MTDDVTDYSALDLPVWHPPFASWQQDALTDYQFSLGHPYTCGVKSSHPKLVPTVDGWICTHPPGCDYTQAWAHNPLRGLNDLRGSGLIVEMLRRRWYALPDDMIGGWCVMPWPVQPSTGYPTAAHFLDETLAQHIVELHNMDLWEQFNREE